MPAGPNPGGYIQLQGDAIRAPEIWRGADPTPAMDVWSLGVSVSLLELIYTLPF